MSNLLNRPPLGLKKEKLKKDKKHLAWVHTQPCVICEQFDMHQQSATQAHHVIHDRFSSRKTADDLAIPLCEGHHQGFLDRSKVAIHKESSRWRELYGSDFSYSVNNND